MLLSFSNATLPACAIASPIVTVVDFILSQVSYHPDHRRSKKVVKLLLLVVMKPSIEV